MVLQDYTETIRCRFLISAGSSVTCSALSAVFNQYRCSLLEQFVDVFDRETAHLPGDLVLLVTVWVPLPESQMSAVPFFIQMPRVTFLIKKVVQITRVGGTQFWSVVVNVFDLYKIVLLKSYYPNYQFSDSVFLVNNFFSIVSSIKSFTNLLYRKDFMLIIFFCTWSSSTKIGFLGFYNLVRLPSFFRFFS